MHFSRDSGVSSVLESSCMPYTLRFSVQRFLALTKKSLFLEMPYSVNIFIKTTLMKGYFDSMYYKDKGMGNYLVYSDSCQCFINF